MSSSHSPGFSPAHLYGRDDALAEVTELLGRASAGAGVTVLVRGEAGIGKSRLTAEVLRRASATGWRIVRANIYEQDRGYPNAVLGGLLSDLLSGSPQSFASLSPFAGDVVRLVPKAASVLTSENGEAVVEGSDARVFQAACIDALLPADQAVFVCVEDVHWADDASFDALITLARAAATRRAVIWLTIRDEDQPPALKHLLAALERERLAREVALVRLNLRQVESIVRELLGLKEAVRADFLYSLYQLTEGNPFFVEEVLRSAFRGVMAQSLDSFSLESLAIPRTIQDAVESRTASLPMEGRQLLETAALLGNRFDFELLTDVSGLPEDTITRHLRTFIEQQLVIEVSEESFAFRHALTAQAIANGLLRRERRALHQRILATLLKRAGEDGAVELMAYHGFEAGEWDVALRYLLRAGQRALAMYAPAVAVHHFSKAMEAARSSGSVSSAEVAYLRGLAFDALSDFDRARQDYEAAIGASSDVTLTWRATLALGLLWASRDYSRALEHYRDAVKLSASADDPLAVGQSLMRLGSGLVNTGDFTTAREYIGRALDEFRRLGDRAAEAEALDLLGMAGILGARLMESAEAYRAALPLLEASNNARTLSSTLATMSVSAGTYQTDILQPAMSLAEGAAYAGRALDLARSLGVQQDEAYARWQLGFCLAPAGRYREALDNTRQALDLAERLGHEQWTAASRIALGAILIDLFQSEEAGRSLETALEEGRRLNSSVWIQQSLFFLVDACVQQGQFDRAEAVLRGNLDGMRDDNMAFRWHEAAAAAFDAGKGAYGQALERLERLIDLAGGPSSPPMRLAYLRARCLHQTGRDHEALDLLASAIERMQAHGHQSLLWRSHAVLASVHFALGDRDRARREADEVMQLVGTLAQEIGDDQLAGQFAHQATLLLPAEFRRRTRSSAEGLTQREREVVGLIAEGLSNRAIAEQLVLSSRTVETHVENAMSKLGFNARSQLAAWWASQNA